MKQLGYVLKSSDFKCIGKNAEKYMNMNVKGDKSLWKKMKKKKQIRKLAKKLIRAPNIGKKY